MEFPENIINIIIRYNLINQLKFKNKKNKLDEINITSYYFNAYQIKNKNILCNFAYLLFDKLFDFKNIYINENTMYEFIKLVSERYHNNSYHNFSHAVFVLHYTYLLIIETELEKHINQYKLFGLMIAALVHDIDHPGHNNAFEINTKSYIALKYNNISVLENHHIQIAFDILEKTLLLNNISTNNHNKIKAIIAKCIISTDMTNHNDLINKFNQKITKEFNFDNINNMILLFNIIIHISDLSNQLKPPNISFEGSYRIHKEFLNQTLKEEELFLPILKSMKITNVKNIYQNELNFCINIIKPLIVSFIFLFPHLEYILNHLKRNIEIYQELILFHDIKNE